MNSVFEGEVVTPSQPPGHEQFHNIF
jgi:hypothetical protein